MNEPLQTFLTTKLKGRLQPVPVNEANDLNALSGVFNGMFHLKIFCLGRTEGLTVVAGLVETANLLLAGCKHIAGITNSFYARLKLLG
ncbi:hypothetical protein EMIT0P43_130177 [Pseudomonas jessenii]